MSLLSATSSIDEVKINISSINCLIESAMSDTGQEANGSAGWGCVYKHPPANKSSKRYVLAHKSF